MRADRVGRGVHWLYADPHSALPAGRRLGRRETLCRATHAVHLEEMPLRGQRYVDAAGGCKSSHPWDNCHDVRGWVLDHLEREGYDSASKYDGQQQQYQQQHNNQQHPQHPQ